MEGFLIRSIGMDPEKLTPRARDTMLLRIDTDQRFRAHDKGMHCCGQVLASVGMIPAAPVPGIAAPPRQSGRSEEIDRA
jgi:hypothetical protein